MKTKLLFVKRRFLIVILFALMFACLIAGATTSVAYAAGEHTDHSGWKSLPVLLFNRNLDGGNYVLGSDFSFDGYVGFTDVIVLCLNGHTINGNGNNIAVSHDATFCDCTGSGSIQNLTIRSSNGNINLNGVRVNGGKISATNAIYFNEGTNISSSTEINFGSLFISSGVTLNNNINVSTGTSLNISGGTFYGAINVSGGTCTITGGTFSGAINVSGGTCNITGGTFSSPINVSGGTCNITGGKISTSQYYTNDPGTPQGAVVVNTGGTCTIGGTAQITGNRVDYGGAVCVNGGTCTISGNNITNNNVTYGAVYVVDGICNIEKDAVISGNKSSYNGGGVYMRNGTCNIRGTITDNYTDSYCHGGGVYVLGGTCNISSTGTVKNNSATNNGGGVYVAGGACNIYGTITNNEATAYGGGVYVAGGACKIYGTITNNKVQANGGGVYVAGGTCSINAQSIIQENTATHSGGGVYVADSQSVFIAGTIDSNIANENGGGVCLISNASLELNGSIVNNSTATGSNPGNGGGIYCGSGCSLTLQSATVITGNKAYGQGGGIYLNGTAANPCTVTFNANTLSSVQQNSIVLNTSSCTLADGKWETDQIGPYFELQDGGEIIIAGGYYSTDPAQQFTIADTVRVVQIDENSGDNNYDAAYPWAVYPVHFEYMSGQQNGSLVYDGQPIEKDTDFTLSLEYSYDDMPFYYWYKAQGADDSAYVLGLPADAGTYTVKVGALYLRSSYKEYWECTFDVAIAKADPSYTVPTNITVPLGDSLSAVQLPDGWTWQDGSIIPDTEGEQTYAIIFTPSDTNNYNIAEEQITVLVKQRVSGAVTDISDISRIYDDTAVSAPTFDSLSTGAAVIEYKEKDADDSTYTTTAPNTVGEYTVRVTVAADADYEEASATRDFSITYLPTPENPYTIINAIEGTNGWYRSTVTLKPAEGYYISFSLNFIYSQFLTYEAYTENAVIYLKNTEGQMTDAITVGTIKIDMTAPIGEIAVGGNTWDSLTDNINFGLFYKDTLEITVTADDDSLYIDAEDYAVTIEYYLHSGDTALTEEELAGKEFTVCDGTFTVNTRGKYVIYVRITDDAGNVTYLNTDGIVLYSDATQDTQNIVFARATTDDVAASVNVNGNTIKEIRNDDYILTDEDYSVSYDGEKAIVTFTATYLTTLTSGEYKFVISYNPLGMDYIDAEGNVAPTDTRVVLNVIKQTGEVTDISDISRIYDDTAVSAPTYVSLSTGAAVIEYKEKGADDSTYTTTAPKTLGEYTVRVTVAADADYEEASATKDFSITYLTVPQEAYSLNGTEGTKGWYRSEVTLTPAEGYTVATSLNGTYEARLIYNDYTDGVVIYLKNADGQMTDAITVGAVKIDKTAPDGDVKFAGNSVKEAFDEIDFGLFFNKNLDVEIVATDEESGAAKIEYFKSDKVLTEEEVAAITAWTTTESNFSITATDGEKFVCYVRITDTAGNVICFGAKGATCDLTAPAISGIQNGGTYCLSQSVTVTDDNLVSVTVNGTEMTEETFTLAVNEGTTYTIVATDIAGNVTEYTVTMKTVETLGESIADLTTGNVTSDNKNTVEEVKEVVETVDAANATETEKAALKEIADKCDELLQKIEETAAACKTENIVKVDQITSDNVTPDDKENLVAAKEDLQNALEQYDGNLTSAEKAAIESKIASIDNALDAIDKAENPEGLSGGAIAGIVIGSVFGALILAYAICAILYKKKLVKGAFFAKIYPFIKD